MNIDKYSERVRGYVQVAQTNALAQGHQEFAPEHVLKELLNDDQGMVASLIERAHGDAKAARRANDAALAKLPKASGGNGQFYLSQPLAKVFSVAEDVCKMAGDSFVTVERLLQALAMEPTAATASTLKNAGVTPLVLNQVINDIRKERTANSANGEQGFDALKKYARDLAEAAYQESIETVIGRDDEVADVIEVLLRRGGHNPVLVGPRGIGKTAIVNALGHRIFKQQVPDELQYCRLLSLDIDALRVSVTTADQFDGELTKFIKSLNEQADQPILFEPELDFFLGERRAWLLRCQSQFRALLKTDVRIIGTMTDDQYLRFLEAGDSLTGYFRPIRIAELTVESTILTMRLHKEKYEGHHRMLISDSALVSAATLSDRYIKDRFLPDKAIDLIDEACSRQKIRFDAKPDELDSIDRSIMRLEIEYNALKYEFDEAAGSRRALLEAELNRLRGQSTALNAVWQSNKMKLSIRADLKAQLDHARHELSISQRKGDLQRAGEVAYGLIPALEKKLSESETASKAEEKITAEHIVEVLSRVTGETVADIKAGRTPTRPQQPQRPEHSDPGGTLNFIYNEFVSEKQVGDHFHNIRDSHITSRSKVDKGST